MSKTKAQILDGVPDVVKASKVANNTVRYEQADGTVCYRLHHTNVVTLRRDGSVTLNSGGWRTVTTKERINRYLPPGYTLFQRDWDWYISMPEPDGEIDFHDGMTLPMPRSCAAVS